MHTGKRSLVGLALLLVLALGLLPAAAQNAVTLVVWNTLLHVCSRYLFVDDLAHRTTWAVEVNLLNWVVLAGSLCVVELRQRRKAAPFPAPMRAAGWALTMMLAMVTT